MDFSPEIASTGDGSHTLRHPVLGDAYHSLHGAVAESLHIYVRNGFESWPQEQARILEAGFGTGLNALLTLHSAEEHHRKVDYTSVELYPVPLGTARQLCYASDPHFLSLHEAPWEEWCLISPGFRLKKRLCDLVNASFDTIFDIVYWDAFAPDTQSELWSETLFRRVRDQMAPGGILLTYSAKGDVKRALRSAGFDVERRPGAPGKRHMIRATKI